MSTFPHAKTKTKCWPSPFCIIVSCMFKSLADLDGVREVLHPIPHNQTEAKEYLYQTLLLKNIVPQLIPSPTNVSNE